MDKPWRVLGLPWPVFRNPHSFCMQRKVTGVSAKPYSKPTVSYFNIAKKCNNMYVSSTLKKMIIPGYLSNEYFPHSDAATSLSKEPANQWKRSDVDNTLNHYQQKKIQLIDGQGKTLLLQSSFLAITHRLQTA